MISKETTKTGAIVSHDLKEFPLVMSLLAQIPAERRIGALIVDETAGRPYAEFAYARDWRVIARQAGIPDAVWNTDARAGAITEAEDAGADLDTIRGSSRPRPGDDDGALFPRCHRQEPQGRPGPSRATGRAEQPLNRDGERDRERGERVFSGRPPQLAEASREIGAGDRDRTDDIQLGKLTFYH